jgi:copper(I)-binding protein
MSLVRRLRVLAAAGTIVIVVVALWVATHGGTAGQATKAPAPQGASAWVGDLQITDATARESTNDVSVLYFTVANRGGLDDELVGESVDPAVGASADLHTTVTNGNAAEMQLLPSLTIPAHTKVTFQTGGYHVMINGLKHSLKSGDRVTVTLTFRNAGAVALTVPVLSYLEAF